MKILHITPSYLPAYNIGGPIKSVHDLNKWLVRRGVDVTVFTTDIYVSGDIPRNKMVNVGGVKVFYFPITWKAWEYSRFLHKALAKNIKNFDLVHITSVFLSASTLGSHYARKFERPYLISPRGSLMKEPLARKSPLKKKIYLSLIENRNLKNAAAVHFTTELERDEYLSGKLPLRKSIIITNGFDIGEFQSHEFTAHKNFRSRFRISDDKKIILFLSRLNWKKGLDTLIPAFAEIAKKEPKAVLVIAGGDEGGYLKEIEKMLRNTDLYGNTDRKVIFTGMLRGSDKIAVFQESDLFVLPSYAENFGLAVVEAMYFGLPVVITKSVGIAPSIEKAEAGLVIEKNVDDLTNAILEILGDSSFARKLGENGQRLVEREFSMSRIADRWAEVYNKLAKK